MASNQQCWIWRDDREPCPGCYSDECDCNYCSNCSLPSETCRERNKCTREEILFAQAERQAKFNARQEEKKRCIQAEQLASAEEMATAVVNIPMEQPPTITGNTSSTSSFDHTMRFSKRCRCGAMKTIRDYVCCECCYSKFVIEPPPCTAPAVPSLGLEHIEPSLQQPLVNVARYYEPSEPAFDAMISLLTSIASSTASTADRLESIDEHLCRAIVMASEALEEINETMRGLFLQEETNVDDTVSLPF
jgi:hypothetical protein